MDKQLVAIVIQECSRLVSGFLSLRSPKVKPTREYRPPSEFLAEPQEQEIGEGKIEKGTACLPCTNSHLHACAGLLDEGVRMSPDGLNPDSMERVDKCLREIAAAERVDLAPDKVAGLPEDERVIAETAAKGMREIRHGLEGLNTKDELEQLAVSTSTLQKYVGKEWFKLRLAKMPKDEKLKLAEKTIERLEQEE